MIYEYYENGLNWYVQRQHDKQGALPAAEVDRLLVAQEETLLRTIAPAPAEIIPVETEQPAPPPEIEHKNRRPIWDRTATPKVMPAFKPEKPQRKRGPKADIENHLKVVALIRRYEDDWILDENLIEILRRPGRAACPCSQNVVHPFERQVPHLGTRVPGSVIS